MSFCLLYLRFGQSVMHTDTLHAGFLKRNFSFYATASIALSVCAVVCFILSMLLFRKISLKIATASTLET